MNILYLGPPRQGMIEFLKSFGDQIHPFEEKLSDAVLEGVDFLVSYGYPFIIPTDVLLRFPRRAINLHISYLPWNRGADPNLWSFLEDTPKGVTIHYIDTGLDTGDILAQRKIAVRPDDTLRTSYQRLADEIEALFKETWPEIRLGRLAGRPQPRGGSIHRRKDKACFEQFLTNGWDTPVAELIGKALQLDGGGL